MSSICPECGQSIEQDFGVAICPQCQSVLNIDLDGNVSLNKKSDEPEPIEEMPVMAPPPPVSDFQEDWINNPSQADPIMPSSVPQQRHNQFNDFNNSELASDNPALHSDEETFTPTSEERSVPSQETSEVDQAQYWPEPTDQNSNEIVIEDNIETSTRIQGGSFDDNQFEPSSEIEDVEIIPDSPGLSGVSEFANSDQSLGALSYTVLIENIDTKDIRIELLDALSDPKFQWDAKAMLKEIKMGKLKLEGLNPVKASVLVDRLQEIPVKVSWTQHAYS